MSFNDIEKHRIRKIVGKFCEERVPDHLRSQLNLIVDIKGFDVKIVETRPYFRRNHEWTEHPIARLNYDPETMKWRLYWRRASGKWMKYPDLKPTTRLQTLIDEIRGDPYRVFCG